MSQSDRFHVSLQAFFFFGLFFFFLLQYMIICLGVYYKNIFFLEGLFCYLPVINSYVFLKSDLLCAILQLLQPKQQAAEIK